MSLSCDVGDAVSCSRRGCGALCKRRDQPAAISPDVLWVILASCFHPVLHRTFSKDICPAHQSSASSVTLSPSLCHHFTGTFSLCLTHTLSHSLTHSLSCSHPLRYFWRTKAGRIRRDEAVAEGRLSVALLRRLMSLQLSVPSSSSRPLPFPSLSSFSSPSLFRHHLITGPLLTRTAAFECRPALLLPPFISPSPSQPPVLLFFLSLRPHPVPSIMDVFSFLQPLTPSTFSLHHATPVWIPPSLLPNRKAGLCAWP